MVSGAVIGINCEINEENCIPCLKGKMSRKPFNDTGTRSNDILDLIHTDLCGPMDTNSISGSQYIY